MWLIITAKPVNVSYKFLVTLMRFEKWSNESGVHLEFKFSGEMCSDTVKRRARRKGFESV